MGTQRAYLPVRLERHWVLVDATAVVEVMGSLEWLPVPQAEARMPGVCAWRGRALAVVDLRRLLGIPSPVSTVSPRTLILDTPSGHLAAPISEARAVIWLEEERLRSVHATSLPYMRAELDDGEAVMPVLDLPALLSALTGGR